MGFEVPSQRRKWNPDEKAALLAEMEATEKRMPTVTNFDFLPKWAE